MPKQKSHKGLSKRVKLTGKGKVRRKRANGSHLMSTKDARRRRRISKACVVEGVVADKIKAALGK
ncbi:50S ribosomal protein L35 [Anaerohalosphaera lusitana]|uniref:Large ribosomal subunit protein bL35 n=1 Tax=Anaerohalosphaera lusitana TaxID=1936003 RepID=A0A1U9NM78_9BACT|nr:50S ribosomal protein L35 [Anaerohalosphaera lusitana]AQT69052.1 50S ribosomal protein L35 [Anaerohalosphaera lusitana]